MLRHIARSIKKSGCREFYHPSSRKLLPGFASYFYSIYIYAAPYAKVIKKTHTVQAAVLRHFLNSKQKDAQVKLTYNYIKDQSTKLSPKILQETLKKNIEETKKHFTETWIENVNYHYNLIVWFTWIVSFDYYLMLKSFDINLKENDYFSKTKFEKTRAAVIIESIKDFLAISDAFNSKHTWQVVFEILSAINVKKVDMDAWINIVNSIEYLNSTKILQSIIRHVEENPYWENIPMTPRDDIGGKYLKELLDNAARNIDKVSNENKHEHLDDIIKNLFGDNLDSLTKCGYNDAISLVYEEHGLEGFTHTAGIRYSLGFLTAYFENIQKVCDIFIVHGEWAARENSTMLSEWMGRLTAAYDALRIFIRSTNEEGKFRNKADEYFNKMVKEIHFKEHLRRLISNINLEAAVIVNNLVDALKKILELISLLTAEHRNKKLTTIINWNSLEQPLRECNFELENCENKISDFLMLMTWNTAPTDE
jgi:hypothetical protein